MAISSINIQPSSGNAIIHNERIFDVAYALKNDDVNEYHRIASISETRKAIYEDYKLHHGRKLNTKATPIREAVVNLNENHTMEDLKKLSEMLDKDYQMKVLHIAIHRDEGHIDKTGEEKINYHAHIVFSNYDFDKHITIKRDKDVMRKLQTDVANCLGMERGEENSQKVRLDHRQYKRAMQEVEEKTKELQRELKEVKQENIELKYSFNKNVYASLGVSAFAVIGQSRSNTFIQGVVVNGTPNKVSSSTDGPLVNTGLSSSKGQFENTYILNKKVVEKASLEGQNNVNYLGFYNFSVGYKKMMLKRHFVAFEPFVKLPIKEVTQDNLRLVGAGLRLKVDF